MAWAGKELGYLFILDHSGIYRDSRVLVADLLESTSQIGRPPTAEVHLHEKGGDEKPAFLELKRRLQERGIALRVQPATNFPSCPP